jgi:hypothetical protein
MRRMLFSIGVFAACVLAASLALAQATQAAPTVVINVERASMRDKATLNTGVIATLTRGEELEVLGMSGAWYHVRVKSTGKVGYVSTAVVQAPQGSPLAAPEAGVGAIAPVFGVQPASRPRAPAVKEHPGVKAFGIVDVEAMTASKSFEAVLGSAKPTVTNLGFGVEGTGLWKGLFARVAYTHSSNTGTRVFVDSSMVAHSLNIPLTIEIAPLEIGAGWRFGAPPRHGVGYRPYVGAAMLLQRYKETSTFADPGENTDTTDKGVAVFGGVEVDVKLIRIGVEGQFRGVPNAIGAGGASLAYNEKDLGGGVFRLTFGVGF